MFSIISKLVDVVLASVLKPAQDEDNDNADLDDYSRQTSDSLVRDQDQQDVLLTTLVDQSEKASDAKVVRLTGKVSQVFCGHGLINGEIYFSDDKANSSVPLQVGDKVTVVARQQFKDGGWTAESVQMLEQNPTTWDEEDEEAPPVPTGDVGKVTHFRNGKGFIGKNIAFDTSVCREGYTPYVGDWVTVELDTSPDLVGYKEDDDDELDSRDPDGWADTKLRKQISYAARVAPARECCYEGVVTAVLYDHGFINGEVLFKPDACVNSYFPRKHDMVRVGAIESSQGKCTWRAVSVVPCSTAVKVRRTRNPDGQQSAGRGRGFLVNGQRPQMLNRPHRMTIPRRLPEFAVPETLRQQVFDQMELTTYVQCLAERLSMANYTLRMDTLLFLEEIQLEIDIQEYSMQRVCLERAGAFLRLEVPGLAEGRPSVLIGDAIILSNPIDPDQPQYEGIVHELHNDAVMLKFNADFQCRYSGEDYNVAFTFNRTPYRRFHQAVRLAVARMGEEMLFPKEVRLKSAQVNLISAANQKTGRDPPPPQPPPPRRTQTREPSVVVVVDSPDGAADAGDGYVPGISHAIQDVVTFYNPCLNDRQKAAVIHILLGQARPLPYVIFGPPGTGKTITVVESILQVLTRVPGSRVIACTPSNSAADLLAERLHCSKVIKMCDMVRLNAFNRSPDGIPASILGYCSTGEKLDVLCRFRIIVATCNTAGLMYTAGLQAGHFTHTFVDEAGQATEPECLIPAGLVAGADGQVILAGDPRQLGPVLMSPLAKMYGLELSLLERLMDRLPYQHNARLYAEHGGGFQSTLVTMLVNNYRSHGSILQLPSEEFYYGALRECAATSLTHTLLQWPLLPSPGIPIVFHGIRSEDVREQNSPSWFNPGEAVQVVKYLQGLLGANPPVAPGHIGVITPYRKQVEKIRMMTERLGIPKVKVGSVEEFQGQERQAIIISMVRSNERLVRSDIRHVLGFLSNPKRFNVAITRAQALLIVIGNPHVLSQDKYWEKFVAMCVRQGSYTGCQLPETLKTTTQRRGHPDLAEDATETAQQGHTDSAHHTEDTVPAC